MSLDAPPELWIATEYPVTRIGYNPDGTMLAYSTNRTTTIIESATGAEILTVPSTQAFAFHPTEPLFAIGANERIVTEGMPIVLTRVTVWNIETGEWVNAPALGGSNYGGSAVDLAFSADGTILAASYQTADFDTCGDRRAFVYWWRTDDLLTADDSWDEAARRTYAKGDFQPPTFLRDRIWVEFTPDGLLVTAWGWFTAGSVIKDIEIHDLATGEQRTISASDEIEPWMIIESLALTADGETVAVSMAGDNPVIRAFDLDTGRMTDELLTDRGTSDIGYRPSGALTVSFDGLFTIHKDGTSRTLGAVVRSAQFFGDVIVTYDYEGMPTVHVREGLMFAPHAVPPEYEGWLINHAPDGRSLVLREPETGDAVLWEVGMGAVEPYVLYGDPDDPLRGLTFSSDGTRYAYTYSYPSTTSFASGGQLRGETTAVVIIDSQTGEVVFIKSATGYELDRVYFAFSDDLRRVAVQVASYSHYDITVYDTLTGELLLTVRDGYSGGFRAFSPDGSKILVYEASFTNCGGDYRAIEIYEIEPARKLMSANVRYDSSYSLNPAWSLLAVPGYGTVYNVATGEAIAVNALFLSGEVAWSADGTALVVTSPGGTASIYGVR